MLRMLAAENEEDVAGKELLAFIAPEQRDRCCTFLDDVIAGASHLRLETAFVRLDGERFPVEVDAGHFVWRGHPGAQIIVRDISERRRAEDEVKRVAEDLSRLIETANAPIFGVDSEGQVNEWNQAAERITGYRKEEVVGRDLVGEFISEEYQAAVKAVLDKALGGEETANFEFPLYSKDGQRVMVLLNSTTRRDAQGNVVGVVGVGQDITERVRAEEEVKSSERRLKVLFEFAPDAIYVNDLKGTFVDGNQAAEELTGYKREELIGKSFLKLKLLPPSQIPKAAALLARNVLGQPTGPDEFTLNRKDGGQVSVEIRTFPVKIQGQSLVLSIARDITEHKRADAQIKASLAEKEVLLREIHHRVKNNLQIVASLLYLQSQKIEDEQTIDMFKESQGRVKSMALIHEDLYRSEDMARIDFEGYIRKLVADLYSSYGLSASRIKSTIEARGVSLGIDTAVPCGLVINELMTNSLKHAFPEGRAGEIKITFHATDDDQFELTVSDDGVGLPDGFDIHQTATLGLRLVHNLVETQLQGTIALDRSKGTQFAIKFREIEHSRKV